MFERHGPPASRRLFAWFVAITIVPAVGLGWLGWRMVNDDRALERQRAQARRDQAAELAAPRFSARWPNWKNDSRRPPPRRFRPARFMTDHRSSSLAQMGCGGGPGSPRGLAVVGIDGTGYRELVGPLAVTAGLKATWSKDSRSIFYCQTMGRPGITRIMRILAEGGTPEFTGVELKGVSSLQLTSDGSHLLVGRVSAAGANELRVIDNLATVLKGSR